MTHDPGRHDEPAADAGEFVSWLTDVRAAIRGEAEAVVPCHGCTACCTSGQFVHIGSDETRTLARVPRELLFPAPGMPRGHFVLGYDEQGRCPMLVESRCSIYRDRPRACRTYDCRVFTAADVAVDDDKPLLAERVRRWRFSFRDAAARTQLEALRAAARFLRTHHDVVPAPAAPRNATQLAVAAVEIHHLFLRRDEMSGEPRLVTPQPETVRAAMARHGRAGPQG